MTIQTRDKRAAGGIRLRQISFHIAGGKAGHPAQNRHGGSEIGAVALFGIRQEAGDEIHIPGLFIHIQRIAEGTAEPGLQRHGTVIGGDAGRGNLTGQIIERRIQMTRQGGVEIQHTLPARILQRGADLDQGAEAGIPGLEERGGDGIGIARLQVSRDEDFGSIGKIRNQIPACGQGANALGDEQGGGAVRQHPDRDIQRSAKGVLHGFRRKQHVKERALLGAETRRLPEKTTAGRRVDPAAAGVLIENHAPEVDRAGGGNLHDRTFMRCRTAAQLILAFRIVALRGKRKHISGFREEKAVQNLLTQVVRLTGKPVFSGAWAGKQEGCRHQERHPWKKRQERGFRETIPGQQDQQRRDGGKKPWDKRFRSRKIDQQRRGNTKQGGRKD